MQVVRGELAEVSSADLDAEQLMVPSRALWVHNVQLVESVARWQREALIVDAQLANVASDAIIDEVLRCLGTTELYLRV